MSLGLINDHQIWYSIVFRTVKAYDKFLCPSSRMTLIYDGGIREIYPTGHRKSCSDRVKSVMLKAWKWFGMHNTPGTNREKSKDKS